MHPSASSHLDLRWFQCMHILDPGLHLHPRTWYGTLEVSFVWCSASFAVRDVWGVGYRPRNPSQVARFLPGRHSARRALVHVSRSGPEDLEGMIKSLDHETSGKLQQALQKGKGGTGPQPLDPSTSSKRREAAPLCCGHRTFPELAKAYWFGGVMFA